MVTTPDIGFPDFQLIRAAVLSALPTPAGFPLEALRDVRIRQVLHSANYLQSYLRDMRLEAMRAQETPIEPLTFSLFRLFEASGDRATFERVYFDRRRRLAGLVLTTILDDTDAYLTTLNELLWEVCNEYTWSLPAHLPVGIDQVRESGIPPEQTVDLFAAHTAHMLAEIVNLLAERLPDWMHYRVRIEIERRIFQPMFYEPRHFWWESASMNWSAVCGGCVGMAALILVEDREQLAKMMDRIVRTMEYFLNGFGSDGGCPEGISYWVYGFGFFTYFVEMLSAFTAGRIDLLQSEHVKQIAAFPQIVSLGDEHFINFSDSPEKVVIHPGLGSRLTARLQQPIPELKFPQFHADHIFRWGHLTRDLLWTDVNALEQTVSEGSFSLHDLAWVVDRRIWNGVTAAFAAKGGHNAEPHNHNDLGHFIIHLGGESLLTDLGAGFYTREYFREARYNFLHTGSHGHSVPLINGLPQKEGGNHLAIPLSYETHSSGLAFALDLTRAYDDPELETFVRRFDWSVDLQHHSAVLRLTDSFDFGSSFGLIEECFISLVPPTIERSTVIWTGKHGKVRMQFDQDMFAIDIQTFETQMHHGESAAVYRVQLRAQKPMQSQTVTFLFRVDLATM
jgi:hypothetical protein